MAVTKPSITLIHDLALKDVTAFCVAAGIPRFRAKQLWHWLYVRLASDWSEMRNLPEELRQQLASVFSLKSAVPIETQADSLRTQKILVGLHDGHCVEEVLIPANERKTVCVSSQVGCKFACVFCASGRDGFVRNLEAGEMVGQVLVASRAYGTRPTHVVFMGVGEPLDNYDSVLKAIRIINDSDGLKIGARRMTISTCGLIPGIERLGEEGLQIELSVSLHAPDDKLRSELMPVNRKYPISEVLEACRKYSEKTKRIVTFEYAMIGRVNDSAEHAARLANLIKSLPCRVNLIPLSRVKEFAGEPSPGKTMQMFVRALADAHINATIRASRGAALQAACGQLRSRDIR